MNNYPNEQVVDEEQYSGTKYTHNKHLSQNYENNLPKQNNEEYAVITAKLETKKLRLRELQKQFDNMCEENASLKLKISELERYKRSVSDKVEQFDKEKQKQDMLFMNRETELLETIKNLEHDVIVVVN